MEHFFIIPTLLLFLCLVLSKSSADDSPSLQDQNHQDDHQLDPLQDPDQDLTINNQDKRTICAALNNKCGHHERLIIKGGLKHQQVIGYAPVVRPVVVGAYRYVRPNRIIHYRLKAPPPTIAGGWKPMHPVEKPVVEVVKPVNHIDVIHNNPLPHVDHVTPVHHHVVRPDHVHLVHLKPVPAGVAHHHVDQVHQVNVPHGNHYDSFTHIDHIQPAPITTVPQPVVPIAPPPTVLKPFVPSPVLFEVTKPNLGVLPLGAKFLTPVLREPPHVHVASPALVHGPPLHYHHHHQPVQGIIHTPVGLPAAIVPQPGVSIEYHGTRNYLPVTAAAAVHQHGVINFGALHPHQHLPVEDAAHGFDVAQHHHHHHHQALPFEHAPHEFAIHQQGLPHEHATQQFLVHEQQLPHATHASAPHFHHQQSFQKYQEIPQGQLPLEGEGHHYFEQGNVIQPGQTDLQIPYHLPQHGGGVWSASGVLQQQQQQEESRGFGDQQVFRPSAQLEPPYTK